MEKTFELAIVGGGVSGLAGAMYAGRLGLATVVFSGTPGGTVMLTDKIENYPGFQSISGRELAEKMQRHAEAYSDVKIVEENVEKAERTKTGSFKLTLKDGACVQAKALLIATGTKWRKLGAPGEVEHAGKGVHYCALCDGYYYKGKRVAVVGGGDSAVKEALQLSQLAAEVTLVARGKSLRAEPVNLKALENRKNVKIMTGVEVAEITGDGSKVSGIVLKDGRTLPAEGVFVAVGHEPLSQLAASLGVKLNARKEVNVDRNAATNVPGVFAAGDVTDSPFKQAVTGAAQAVTAAHSAFEYLKGARVEPSGDCGCKGV